MMKFRLTILPVITVIFCTTALAGSADPTPADIRTLLGKLSANQVMSAAEEGRLTTWYRGVLLENTGAEMEAPPTTDPFRRQGRMLPSAE